LVSMHPLSKAAATVESRPDNGPLTPERLS
jgi:hypothetical protein